MMEYKKTPEYKQYCEYLAEFREKHQHQNHAESGKPRAGSSAGKGKETVHPNPAVSSEEESSSVVADATGDMMDHDGASLSPPAFGRNRTDPMDVPMASNSNSISNSHPHPHSHPYLRPGSRHYPSRADPISSGMTGPAQSAPPEPHPSAASNSRSYSRNRPMSSARTTAPESSMSDMRSQPGPSSTSQSPANYYDLRSHPSSRNHSHPYYSSNGGGGSTPTQVSGSREESHSHSPPLSKARERKTSDPTGPANLYPNHSKPPPPLHKYEERRVSSPSAYPSSSNRSTLAPTVDEGMVEDGIVGSGGGGREEDRKEDISGRDSLVGPAPSVGTTNTRYSPYPSRRSRSNGSGSANGRDAENGGGVGGSGSGSAGVDVKPADAGGG